MMRWSIAVVGILGVGLHPCALHAAETPHILELRTQKVDGSTYFQVRLERPADLSLPNFDTSKAFSEADRRKFAAFPQLIAQDNKTRTVYYRHRPTQPGLSFCGQVTSEGKAAFVLLYPTRKAPVDKPLSLTELAKSQGTSEVAVVVDFSKAQVVPVPVIEKDDQHIHRDDMRSCWALHQAAHFAVLETQVLDFHFYSFAREATGRKYGVVAPAWVRRQLSDPEHRLYEITTGADALAETLQLHRMLQTEVQPKGERTVSVKDIIGVTTPEQPWDRLLGDKKPKVEALARLVPDDNYYVYCKDVRKLIELGELLDQWGTNILRVYEVKSRDFQLRERYEKQLCLKSTLLGKLLGPTLIKGVAITGNDPYVREGSDVSVIFHVRAREPFLAAVEPFLQEARKEFGKELSHDKKEHRGVVIESYVSPLREVSLHRAAFEDYVVYSNSSVAIRRILDRHAGKDKTIADSKDYQYMRTVFGADDKSEDGFVFLSDAFIRQLTGPASRIKEKRRLEALTSLYLLTNAALFGAWETGKLPADHATALSAAGLKAEDIAVSEGKGARWNAKRELAISDVYNTIHFATPLIELPIDGVTKTEAAKYARFREAYSTLWRTYFDPIGLRLTLEAKRVRAEVHILPLAGSDQYRSLRQTTGGGTFHFESRPEAVLDFRLSIGEKQAVSFHVGGSTQLRDLVEMLLRGEEGAATNLRRDYDKKFWSLPLGVGLHTPDEEGINGADGLVKTFQGIQLLSGEPTDSTYKDVKIHRLPIDAKKYRELAAFVPLIQQQSSVMGSIISVLPTQEAPTALHIALIDKAIQISASETMIKQMIDEAAARKKAPEKKPIEKARESNAALFLSLGNAREAANLFLEYEGHCLALLNNEVWNCFHRAGLLTPEASEAERKKTVRRYLGFVPMSADNTAYRYDARRGEIINSRHGTYRRPKLHDRVAEGSELFKFLDQIKAIQAELRFTETGLHSVLTIDRR